MSYSTKKDVENIISSTHQKTKGMFCSWILLSDLQYVLTVSTYSQEQNTVEVRAVSTIEVDT